MQVECLHFEAYVHVCTIMWRVVFKELRGLTNSKVTLTLTLTPFLSCLLFLFFDFQVIGFICNSASVGH